MSLEDKLSGARNVFALYYAYVNSVAQAIGMDKAIAISADVDTGMGALQGRMIKEQSGMAEFDVRSAAEAARDLIKEDFGILTRVIEDDPTRIVLQCGRCPVFEGAEAVGWEARPIEDQCRKCSLGYMDAVVKELNPRLSYRLRKFRTSAEDVCEEEIVME